MKRREVFDLRCAVSLRLTKDRTHFSGLLLESQRSETLKNFRKVAGKSEPCRASEVKDLTCRLKIPWDTPATVRWS
jgi:hypothetical protein